MLILIFVAVVIIVIFGNIELLEFEVRFALIGYFFVISRQFSVSIGI